MFWVLHRLMKKGKPDYLFGQRSSVHRTPLQHSTDADLLKVTLRKWHNECFTGTMSGSFEAEWFQTTSSSGRHQCLVRQYNIRPHHALNIRPPIPETLLEKPLLKMGLDNLTTLQSLSRNTASFRCAAGKIGRLFIHSCNYIIPRTHHSIYSI